MRVNLYSNQVSFRKNEINDKKLKKEIARLQRNKEFLKKYSEACSSFMSLNTGASLKEAENQLKQQVNSIENKMNFIAKIIKMLHSKN